MGFGSHIMRLQITFRLDMQIVFRLQFHIPYFFSVSLKFQACYIPVQWGDLTVKNVTQLNFQKGEELENST